jgi:hypothetical protein
MSTFYGGPQLSSVTTYSGYASAGGKFTYTVPSGFWGEITFIAVRIPNPFGGGFTVAEYEVNVSGTGYSSVNVSESITISLSSGQSVAAFNFYSITVKLYKNP